jgi:hypothetical protein
MDDFVAAGRCVRNARRSIHDGQYGPSRSFPGVMDSDANVSLSLVPSLGFNMSDLSLFFYLAVLPNTRLFSMSTARESVK